MRKRALGKTGMEVSEIAFGGVEIGMPYGIGVENTSDMLTETEAVHLLHTALGEGVNFFDTARMYGNSETIMGKAFRDRRERVIIASKCVHFKDENGKIPEHTRLKKIIETSLQESLAALQTDYIDVFMLHQADESLLVNEDVCRIYTDLKHAGVIRATGASTYSVTQTEKAIEVGAWDVIQLPFNLMDQRQATAFALANQKGIGIVVRSVLFKGILSQRSRNLHPALQDVAAHIKYYDALLNDSMKDLPVLATKFALSHEEVSSILVGIDRMEYLYASLEAANGKHLDKNTLSKAKALHYPDPAFLDLHKWDKMGWLK